MNVKFAEDADLELFEQLKGWRIEVTLTPAYNAGKFRILGIEQTDAGDNVLYGFPVDVDGESPGWDRYLSTGDGVEQATALPVDLIAEMTIWP